MMRALTILLLLLSCARVEAQSTLGDPITLDGVEVRGLRLRRDERPLPRVQSRGALRISLVSGRRGRHGGTHGVVSVCGRDAVRIETHTSAEPSVRVQIRPTCRRRIS